MVLGVILTCSAYFLLYCDDIVVYTTGTDVEVILNDISEQLANVHKWCWDNNMKLNFEKTKYMIFSKTPVYNDISATLNCCGQDVERLTNFKYLGVIFEESMTFDIQFAKTKSKINGQIKFMYGITFRERVDLSLLKGAFMRVKDGNAKLFQGHERSFPRMVLPTHSSITFKRSTEYREAILWNNLPRHWTWEGLTLYLS